MKGLLEMDFEAAICESLAAAPLFIQRRSEDFSIPRRCDLALLANYLRATHRADYEANRFAVIRQFHFSAERPNEGIDLVILLNGLPLLSMEVKNEFTGQTWQQAETQYRQDRPAADPFLKACLVHFALDTQRVSMTTGLANGKTHFLPFNRDLQNPPIPGNYAASYLWEEILTADSLLDLVQHYLHWEDQQDAAGILKPEEAPLENKQADGHRQSQPPELERLAAVVNELNERFHFDFEERDKVLRLVLPKLAQDQGLVGAYTTDNLETLRRQKFSDSLEQALPASAGDFLDVLNRMSDQPDFKRLFKSFMLGEFRKAIDEEDEPPPPTDRTR